MPPFSHHLIRSSILLFALMVISACGGGGSASPSSSSSLSYPSDHQTFVVGTPITPITPTVTGTLSSYSVSPSLPAGLSLDASNGIIAGTPQAVTPTATYTVTAMVSGGTTTSGALSITVNDIAPSQVSYGAPSFSFSTTVASTKLTPSAKGGAVVSWSINPALPAGLTFSTTDGSIAGTPTATAASATYVVTAQNTGGQATVSLTIAVDGSPLIDLGHQNAITMVRETSTRVLSLDVLWHWILWDYTDASVIASGASDCGTSARGQPPCPPSIDVAGPTAVILTREGLEVRAASDGHLLSNIATAVAWWKLATDGSYIAAGSKTGLSAWSPSGQLLLTRPGDYSQGVGFAAPSEILVGAGAAGQNVVETIAVPGGAAATTPPFNGQFGSWFTDGAHFTTLAGNTVLVYDSFGVPQGNIASVPTGATVVGEGNWVWTYPNPGAVLNVYTAIGTNTAPTATYTLSALAKPYASGLTVGVLTLDSLTASVIDLSGSSPARTDYPVPYPLGANDTGDVPYAAVSASQWLAGNQWGAVLDGASLGGTARSFGYGQVWSMAGGTGHFAIATASATILYFDSVTLALEGRIPFNAGKIALSADGTVLVAQGAGDLFNVWPVKIYSLPTGNRQYTWPYDETTSAQDIALSGNGTVLGQVLFSAPGGAVPYYTQQAGAPTGGSQVFSTTFNSTSAVTPPPALRISPDGALIAASQMGVPRDPISSALPGTELLHNGVVVTAFSGLPAGWLDNGRLLVDNYATGSSSTPTGIAYSGCTIYGSNGVASGGACALSHEVAQFQAVGADTIYVPVMNEMVSVSTGAVSWMSADPFQVVGGVAPVVSAVAGTRVIFVSGSSVLAQSFGN